MRFYAILAAALAVSEFGNAQTEGNTYELDPIVATADRILADGAFAQSAVSTLGLPDLELGSFRDISDALASYPGLASYRRTHPTSAHPTTQGVRLRNFGANASSRALVLYNGVPQNDPFGGWIYWHAYDTAQLEAISIHPSGIGEIWGNMASGGLVSMIAQEADPGARYAQATIGSSDRFDLKAYGAESLSDELVFDIGIRHFESSGFYTLREDQRGSVDEPADSKATSLNSRLSWNSGDNWKSQLGLRLLDEKRGNGTALARNNTKALDLSFISERELAAQNAKLNLNLYLQDREFQNVFTSVADDRNSERPALDQYKVPAKAVGGALVYRKEASPDLSYATGLDFRFVEGSVSERFRNLGAGFTRDRYAGGEQEFFGVFAKVDVGLSDSDRLSLTARGEEIRRQSGQRIETDTQSQNTLLADHYANRSDTVFSGNLNWNHRFSESASTQLALFTGYRAPTLNELYRPFRVRNDITESNPELANERHQGLELSFMQQPTPASQIRVSTFYYEAEEMVANALLTTRSGFDPRFGFIPAGGSGSARVNLDESRVSGFELQLDHSFSAALQATLTAVYSNTEILRDELTELQGNAFPQSAPWKAVASLRWSPNETLSLWANYRWYDRSWENLSNTRRLGATSDLSLGVRYELDDNNSISLSLVNALDETNVTGLATNGLVTIDEPRELQLSYTWKK